MYVAILFVLVTFVYTTINLVLVMLRNHRAHQFFKTKISGFPVLEGPNIFTGHLFDVVYRGDNVKIIDKLHKTQGHTFGYYMCEQPWVSTKNLELLKLIMLDDAQKHINHAPWGLPFKEFNDSILQLEGDAWRRTRRAVAPSFTNHKVRSGCVMDDIQSVIRQLERGIESRMQVEAETGQSSMILDACDMFQRYTLQVIFLVTYRREDSIDFLADRDDWVHRIDHSARNVKNPFVAASVIFPFARPIIEFFVQFHPVGKIQAQLVQYIVEATDINRVAREQHQKIQRKLSETGHGKEQPFNELKQLNGYKRRLVDTIIDAFMEKRINYDEFIGTTVFLLLAGFETTADTITCLVWHLARHPEIQEKLRDCVRKEGIDSEYLHWCIQETIRYHPAVPLGTGRIVGEDIQVDGMRLARGTFVMPSSYSIHHDPSIWPNPEKYEPERWRDSANFHPAAFMGFGLGPRNCVGGKLAVMEIKLVIELLLKKYRIEKCPQTPDEYAFSSPGLLYTNLDVPIKVRLVRLDDKTTCHDGHKGDSAGNQ